MGLIQRFLIIIIIIIIIFIRTIARAKLQFWTTAINTAEQQTPTTHLVIFLKQNCRSLSLVKEPSRPRRAHSVLFFRRPPSHLDLLVCFCAPDLPPFSPCACRPRFTSPATRKPRAFECICSEHTRPLQGRCSPSYEENHCYGFVPVSFTAPRWVPWVVGFRLDVSRWAGRKWTEGV